MRHVRSAPGSRLRSATRSGPLSANNRPPVCLLKYAFNLRFGQIIAIYEQDMSLKLPIVRQILLMIVVSLVVGVRFQNVAVGDEAANDQQQRFSIAVPDFPDNFSSDGTSGHDAARTVIADLRADGRFTLVNSSINLEANAVLPRLESWRGTNAKWLVVGSIRQSPDLEYGIRARVEIRLWNVVKGTHGSGWQYYARSADLQRVYHCAAMQIIKQLTSTPDPSDVASNCD